MSEGNTAEPPPVTVPLAGGGELRVDGEGLRLHGHLYRLDQVLDARLLSPYPEVIGMTIAGFAPFTLMSVRPGDGAAALEAIYGRRPELRVAAPPLPPPGAWGAVPPPAFGPQPGIPPTPGGAPAGFPAYPQGAAFPPPPFGPAMSGPGTPGVPGTGAGGLGFWPQGIGEVIGTTFRLYFKNFPRFALISLAVAFVPAILGGAIQVAYYVALGFDPTQGLIQNLSNFGSSSSPFFTGPNTGGPYGSNPPPFIQWFMHPDPGTVLAVIGIGLLVVIVAVLLNCWQAAALALGAREAVLGRTVRVGAALGGGLRRVPAVLGVYVLIALVFIGIEAVLGVIFVLLAIVFILVAANSGGLSADGTPSPGLAFMGIGIFLAIVAFYIVLIVLVVSIFVRLGLAPYAAAADRLSPTAAFGRSWSLVRRNWWRTFLPVFVIGIIVGFVVGPVGAAAQFVSIAAIYLVVIPLISALATPLTVIAYVVIYYDLRLRREGYPALASQLGLPPMPAMPMMPFWPPVGMPPSGMPPTGAPFAPPSPAPYPAPNAPTATSQPDGPAISGQAEQPGGPAQPGEATSGT